jgi:peptide/nickel transport system permease protein
LTYLGDVLRLDLGYSIAHYPPRVSDVLAESPPWTIGLLATTTIVAFVVGTILGALLGWPKSPRFVQYLFPPLLTPSAVPYFLLGLLLLYLFAFRLKLLPLFGGYTPGTFPSFSLSFALDGLRHSILPAASILLASLGFWALGMRAMTVTVEGENFMTFAEASGLRDRTLFYHYVIRKALLPQTTALGLALGQILSGALLV